MHQHLERASARESVSTKPVHQCISKTPVRSPSIIYTSTGMCTVAVDHEMMQSCKCRRTSSSRCTGMISRASRTAVGRSALTSAIFLAGMMTRDTPVRQNRVVSACMETMCCAQRTSCSWMNSRQPCRGMSHSPLRTGQDLGLHAFVNDNAVASGLLTAGQGCE